MKFIVGKSSRYSELRLLTALIRVSPPPPPPLLPIYEGNIQGTLILAIEFTNAYDFAIQISIALDFAIQISIALDFAIEM